MKSFTPSIAFAFGLLAGSAASPYSVSSGLNTTSVLSSSRAYSNSSSSSPTPTTSHPAAITSGYGSPQISVSIQTVVVTEHVTDVPCAAGSPTSISSASPASSGGYSGSSSDSPIRKVQIAGDSSNSGPDSSSAPAPGYATTAASSFVPGPTLSPAVHWDYPVDDIKNLAPRNSSDLYYSLNGTSDPTVQHLFASLTSTLQYESVVLDHSSFVSNTTCTDNGVLVTFTTSAAFNFAHNSWHAVQDFVLITNVDGCGATSTQRSFWLIDSLSFQNGTQSVLAKVQRELSIEEALDEVSIAWGTYYPPGANATTAGSTGSDSSNQTDPSLSKRRFGDIHKTLTKTASVDFKTHNDATTPWGPGTRIFEAAGFMSKGSASPGTTGSQTGVAGQVGLYCVNCGFSGSVTIAGTATWNLFHGLSALNVNVNANMAASLNLGIVAQGVYKNVQTKNLLNQAIPDLGISVAGVFSAGCFITIDAAATLTISAVGDALMGFTMTIPNFSASLNLLDEKSAGSSNVAGYKPTFTKTFEAEGELTASAQLGFPIALNIGLEINPINFKKTIALIEEPSLFGNVTFAGSTPGAPPASATCNDGVAYLVDAQNDVKFSFFGLKTFTLNHWESPPIVQGCYLIPGLGAKSTSVSSASTVATTGRVTSTMATVTSRTVAPATTSTAITRSASASKGNTAVPTSSGSLRSTAGTITGTAAHRQHTSTSAGIYGSATISRSASGRVTVSTGKNKSTATPVHSFNSSSTSVRPSAGTAGPVYSSHSTRAVKTSSTVASGYRSANATGSSTARRTITSVRGYGSARTTTSTKTTSTHAAPATTASASSYGPGAITSAQQARASTAPDGDVYVTSTVYKETPVTVLACHPTRTACPPAHQTHTVTTTATVPDYVTVCPVTASLPGVPSPTAPLNAATTLGFTAAPLTTYAFAPRSTAPAGARSTTAGSGSSSSYKASVAERSSSAVMTRSTASAGYGSESTTSTTAKATSTYAHSTTATSTATPKATPTTPSSGYGAN